MDQITDKTYRIPILTTALVVLLDITTKIYWFKQIQPWTTFAPILQTVQHRNQGLIFNLPAPLWFIVGLSTCVLIAVTLFLHKKARQDTYMAIALGLLLGGALGNIYDRLTLGFVRDWILTFNRSAFNIADLAIVISLIILAMREKTPSSLSSPPSPPLPQARNHSNSATN